MAMCVHKSVAIPRARGFTLLEVLIALLILAIALFALTRTAGSSVSNFAELRDRTLAGWVAANVLAETRLKNAFPDPGKSDGDLKYAARDWRWELVVQSTEEPRIRRLDIRVSSKLQPQTTLAQLTGFAGQDLSP
ncbi:type II secretion system protein GspI [Pseudolysobacter antarcticus]|uniref:Type II secretion system protein I n=2 Tax=Pseudolysobacter antarcticus TaxID=2511995 RepID=A0A411HMM5_9GAMM|nr:type II secretion system protein GspI [Pseudolysobacter antarcticus]